MFNNFFCLGFGIPMYSYLPMADGNILAEVSLINLGVIGRAAAKTKIEVCQRNNLLLKERFLNAILFHFRLPR